MILILITMKNYAAYDNNKSDNDDVHNHLHTDDSYNNKSTDENE